MYGVMSGAALAPQLAKAVAAPRLERAAECRVEHDKHTVLIEAPDNPRHVRGRRAGALSRWDTHAEPKRRYELISRIMKTAAIICKTHRMSTPILS